MSVGTWAVRVVEEVRQRVSYEWPYTIAINYRSRCKLNVPSDWYEMKEEGGGDKRVINVGAGIRRPAAIMTYDGFILQPNERITSFLC